MSARARMSIRGGLKWAAGALPRTLAWFLSLFSLMNLALELRLNRGDANIWWIDFGPLPRWAADALLLLATVALLGFAWCAEMARWRLRTTAGLVLAILLFALYDAVQFYVLLGRGELRTSVPLPMSAFIAGALLVILASLWNRRHRQTAPSLPSGRLGSALTIASLVAVVCVAFALLQMWCFGHSDYRRQADAIVVPGALAYASGRCSPALGDRVRTAAQLYHQGYAPRLIFSGGPGQGQIHETQAMRQLAVELGVPDKAILCDTQGLNTQTTAANTAEMFRHLGVRRALVVSHWCHLPRIKLAYQRQGIDVCTVPASETEVLTAMPYYVGREVAAFWVYYLSL